MEIENEVTIATHNGSQVARQHNLRNPKVICKEDHIDPEGHFEVWLDEDPKAAYERLFGEARPQQNRLHLQINTAADHQVGGCFLHHKLKYISVSISSVIPVFFAPDPLWTHKLSHKHWLIPKTISGGITMSERCQGSVRCNVEDLQEALSIHTRKITDSCRDKDCIEDLRVYLTRASQNILDSCAGAKVRCGELLYTYIDVEPVAFDRNHYCVDATFYYRILADGVVGAGRPVTLHGVAVFSKRAVLCGEESHAHIFTSNTRLGGPDGFTRVSANLPTAVVEVLDPMVLSSKVVDVCQCPRETAIQQIPEGICSCFDEELVLSGEQRRLLVTLGQFSIIRLERDAQLVVPVLDYSLPTKECCDSAGCAEDPCELFSKIPFPAQAFAPTGCDRDCDREECRYTTT